MELVKHGLLLSTDKVRYRVYYAKPRIKVTVCYRCAGFNQHSKNWQKAPKCFKCSKDHVSWDCPTIPIKSSNTDNFDRSKFKFTCPGCGGDHPQTYAKCPTYQNASKTRRGNQDSESYRVYSDNPASIKFGTNHQAVHNHTQVPQQHLAPTNNLSQMIHNQPSIVDQPLQSDLLASILKELQKLNGRFDMIESRVLSLEKDVKATRPPLQNTTSEPYPHLPLFNKSQPSPTSIRRWTFPAPIWSSTPTYRTSTPLHSFSPKAKHSLIYHNDQHHRKHTKPYRSTMEL